MLTVRAKCGFTPCFRAVARWVHAFAWTFVVSILSACDAITAGKVPANAHDPNASVNHGDSEETNPSSDFIGPMGEAGSEASKLSIEAYPVFCCNPLTFEFTANPGVARSDFGVNYSWAFGDGRAGRGKSLKHTYPFDGIYSVRLTANFQNGDVETVVTNVTIGEGGSALPSDSADGGSDPTSAALKAVAGPDIETLSGETVILDGSESKGSGVHELRFRWMQVAGPLVTLNGTTASVSSFTAPEPEEGEIVELRFELIVADLSSTASDSVSIRVMRRPDPLVVANAGPDRIVDGGSTVVLDGSLSRGTGPRDLEFSWAQVGGAAVPLSTPTAMTATFVAPAATNRPIYLKFELTVTQGAILAKDTIEIAVGPVSTTPPPSEEQMIEWLSALAPLQKTHYSWPFPMTKLREFNANILREYMRITGAVSVWGEWVDQDALNRAISIAFQVNDTEPERPVSIGLVFRPWSRAFPPAAPPTYQGPEVEQEINLFVTRLATIRDWVEEANRAHYWDPIEVTAIILECERFVIKPQDDTANAAWNAAIDAKHDIMYEAAKDVFPDARVEWYARGLSDLFTLDEQGDSFSVPLYQVPDRVSTRTLFRRTHDVAVSQGNINVTPWIALGSGYVSLADGTKVWSWDYDYDIIYSWHIGGEVNDPWFGDRPQQFAPWHSAKVAIFWPAPWDDSVPNWGRHFVAYVRGAHNITELPR